MMATVAPIVGVIDGDMQHDEAILPNLYSLIADTDTDIAVGSRYIAGGGTESWASSRMQASSLATWLGNLVIGTPSTDPMSGFFAIRRSLVVELQPRLSGIGFKLLIDLLASSKRKLIVRDVPYIFRGRVAGDSKMGSAVAIEYLMVGGMGVGVHLSVLGASLYAGASFPIGQSLAVAFAILFNFTLNNILTYRDRQLKGWKFLVGLASFAAISSVGAIANVGVGSFVFSIDDIWWQAGIAGALISSIWNYAASSYLTWRKN
jgi:dolichol-phosphate mannosyltransferase